jgi:16S rRNA (guanine966-N2)-methyltransferase
VAQNKRVMHVISGTLKGRKIVCPPGEIRPMTARVRESLFNILGNLDGTAMLDLFTGSGSIAIEAISHGAGPVDMVEMDSGKRKVILSNLEHCGITNATLFGADAVSFCKRARGSYDLVMADPPFRWMKKEELIETIADQDLLNDNGTLVIHLPKKEKIAEEIRNLLCYDVRSYGLNTLLFYRKG